jgi:hypothetical protein
VNTFTPNTTGVFLGLSNADYHAAPGVSNSMLHHMDPPARLPVYICEEFEETAAMRMGTIIHAMILEPDDLPPAIAVKPETYPGAKGEAKKWTRAATYCAEWEDAQKAAGRLLLSSGEWERTQGCVDAIRRHPLSWLFDRGQAEVSVFTRSFGPLTKYRPDFVPDGANIILDIKKVCEGMSEPNAFAKLAVDRGYHRQAESYRRGWNEETGECRTHVVFVVVEDVAPFLVSFVTLGPKTMQVGWDDYLARLGLYEECLNTGMWPGRPTAVVEVEAKEWQLRSKESND